MSDTTTRIRNLIWTRGLVSVAVRESRKTARSKERIGTHEIEADLWGPFAVHQTLDPWTDDWTVTHAPTGYAMFRGARTKGAAKTFCREVVLLWDWESVTAPDGIKVMPAHVKSLVLEAIRRARS